MVLCHSCQWQYTCLCDSQLTKEPQAYEAVKQVLRPIFFICWLVEWWLGCIASTHQQCYRLLPAALNDVSFVIHSSQFWLPAHLPAPTTPLLIHCPRDWTYSAAADQQKAVYCANHQHWVLHGFVQSNHCADVVLHLAPHQLLWYPQYHVPQGLTCRLNPCQNPPWSSPGVKQTRPTISATHGNNTRCFRSCKAHSTHQQASRQSSSVQVAAFNTQYPSVLCAVCSKHHTLMACM